MRTAQTLPRPTTPSTAMTTWAGRIMATAAAGEDGQRPGRRAVRPAIASPYIASRTATRGQAVERDAEDQPDGPRAEVRTRR